MGNPVSKIRKELEANNYIDIHQRRKIEQRLQILERMVEWQIQARTTSMLSHAGEKTVQQPVTDLPTGTIVKICHQVNIIDFAKRPQTLKNAIGNFFESEWEESLEKIIRHSSNGVLNNSAIGEYESTDMFIIRSFDTVLRCDMYYYRWNFVSKDVIEIADGVVGILLVTRVIDLTKTGPMILSWVNSDTTQSSNQVGESGVSIRGRQWQRKKRKHKRRKPKW